jgi:putative membrane protein
MDDTQPVVNSAAENSSNKPTPAQSKGSLTDHLANERTFLAWTRTSLAIFAIGLAIARFGGSSSDPSMTDGSFNQRKAMISGILLVAYSIVALLYGIYRYHRINRQIIRKDLTIVSQIREPIIATLILFLCMVAILIIFIIL